MAQEKERQKKFSDFLIWFKKHCGGKERAEGQLFFERLLRAFGNAGLLECGAVCEDPIKKKTGKTGFADLVWRPRVIIELKGRGTNLKKHYAQAEEYWMRLVPNRPQYMILCNFDEFWIYDLNTQLNDPVHVLKTENLATEYGALAFLFPQAEKPLFNNNNVEVTEEAAKIVGAMFLSLKQRQIDSHKAQRFVLQLVVALFSEDVGLIPKYTLQRVLRDAVINSVLQAELSDLFKAMATEAPGKKPRKYKDVPYFNGGLFNSVESFELKFKELDLLAQAADQDWSKVRPSIFGSIFEASMDQDARHGHGVHFTSELDIQKIVNPTIVRPFRERIMKAKNKKELAKILEDIQSFKVLDPACGSGNFLYVAFRELRRLEVEIYELIEKNFNPKQMRFGLLSPKNFYGIDTNEFGLELAKVALSIGRKLSADEFGISDNVLPFDNLDKNFSSKDALFQDWPKADAIVGNPPFIDGRRIGTDLGSVYLKKLRDAYPSIPGRADYCVYWIKKAHDSLATNGRAGLVGTNSIRQNYSREGGLDYVVAHGGNITEAVSSQVWLGDAAVHVSIVNWIKGKTDARLKRIFTQLGDSGRSEWKVDEVKEINSSLSSAVDVGNVPILQCNLIPKLCFEGIQPGHDGFRLETEEFARLIQRERSSAKVISPYMNGQDFLTGKFLSKPTFIIDFGEKSINEASEYKAALERIKSTVLPDWRKAAKKENEETGKESGEHQNRLKKWWQLKRPRKEMWNAVRNLDRYIICVRHTKRPVFEFVSTVVRPDSSLVVFAFNDDYSFGILQSQIHWHWFIAKGSTIVERFRYTSDTVFDTFPWPQNPTLAQVRKVAAAAREFRAIRVETMNESKLSYRSLYRNLELPGDNPLKTAAENLDVAVCAAYGIKFESDYLASLLALNSSVAAAEAASKFVQGPGVPRCVAQRGELISTDKLAP